MRCSEFKTVPARSSNMSSTTLPKLPLTPFTQALYDTTSPAYSYPSPTTPTAPNPPQSISVPEKEIPLRAPLSPATPSASASASLNKQTHYHNSAIKVQTVGHSQKVEQAAISTQKPPSQPSNIAKASGPSFEIILPARRPEELQGHIPQAESRVQSNTPSAPTFSQPESTSSQASKPKLSSVSNSNLSVVVPVSSTLRPEDYAKVQQSPSPTTPQHLSTKRERHQGDGTYGELITTHDQRQKAESALKKFIDYLQDIFEEENQQQHGVTMSTGLLTTANDGTCLATSTQSKIDRYLVDIFEVGRFSQVSLDDLLRLQKLSENGIKDAEVVDVKVDDSIKEPGVGRLVEQFPVVVLGLKSARTSLRLMTGGRQEKQLYSEDVIQAALNVFKNITETCIIPVVEMRSTGASAVPFKLLSAQKKGVADLLSFCRQLLSVIAAILNKVELSETIINGLEFIVSRLIFVENTTSEKDSIIGIAKFESLRVVAMDVLAQIFQGNPDQRRGIFDEILTSLDKLQVSKQGVRQFRLAGGGNIQLVSALIMRLIQTSANKIEDTRDEGRKALEALTSEDKTERKTIAKYAILSEARAEQQVVTAVQELGNAVNPLIDSSKTDAHHIVSYITTRALKSTKSGETPYRNLLDLFITDFIECLKDPAWPAAELLLRLFLYQMVGLVQADKTPAPARNMAIDVLGAMAAGMSELRIELRELASSLRNDGSSLGKYLFGLADGFFHDHQEKIAASSILSWPCGPFRVSLQYLEARRSMDPHLNSAVGFHTAEWASRLPPAWEAGEDIDPQAEREYGKLAYRLRMMIDDKRWLSTEYSFEDVDSTHARIAYGLTVLDSQFFQYFQRVLNILWGSMTSEQATVRNKAIKCVEKVVCADPAILDRDTAVKKLVMRSASDDSPMVRDSVLGLINNCMTLRPAIEEEMVPSVLERVSDPNVGVRKKAMKLAKDIYLRNSKVKYRSQIADVLLRRVEDPDETVQDAARQVVEEIWMSSFYETSSTDTSSAQFKRAVTEQVTIMITTVQRGGGLYTILDKALQNILSSSCKNQAANFKVCTSLVVVLFESIIANSSNNREDAPSARDALRILEIFAKSNAKLFTSDQIKLLHPYITNVDSKTDSMAVYRSVVIIFRHILPHLPAVHTDFLVSVKRDLTKSVSKMSQLPKLLEEVIACLWIIAKALDDHSSNAHILTSSLKNIRKIQPTQLAPADKAKLMKLLTIAGLLGKHCDLEPFVHHVRTELALKPKETSVSKIIVDTFAPFASPGNSPEIRLGAIESIGWVCRSWPKNFNNANVACTFKEIFASRDSVLEGMVLQSFKNYMILEEQRSEASVDDAVGAAAEGTAKLGVMGGGQGDGVAITIARSYQDDIIRIALGSQSEDAFLAAELIASFARQGLNHPKECIIALIALETSQNPKIAGLACKAHQAMHEKHESMLEREYMRAVRQAYKYQRDVAKDTRGATLDPFAPKLGRMINILKISKPKSRIKFYERLCAEIEFDPEKLTPDSMPEHLEFAQFIIENMAFFEYATIEELLAAILAMEKVVAATGTGIANIIETEILHVGVRETRMDENGQSQDIIPEVDDLRLLMITASSMMLSCLWEARTYLRRQYGLSTNQQKGKTKANKEFHKAPSKVASVTADKFWEVVSRVMSTVESESKDAMIEQCRYFVNLLNIDQDFKIAAEGDDGRLATPSEDEEDGTPGPPGTGRGRKRKAAGTPGGRKKRARSSSVTRGRGRPKGSGKRASLDNEDDSDV